MAYRCAAEQLTERVAVDGQVLPPRLPATAEAFIDGWVSLRHVEVVVQALTSPAAGRLTCSDASKWITSVSLPVDAGLLLK